MKEQLKEGGWLIMLIQYLRGEEGLSDFANKNIGHPVRFEFQVNFFFLYTCVPKNMWEIQFNWASSILSGNPAVEGMRSGQILDKF